MNGASSFLRFLLGFLVFIGVSFAVTYGVHTYTAANEAEEQAAAAIQALVPAQ